MSATVRYILRLKNTDILAVWMFRSRQSAWVNAPFLPGSRTHGLPPMLGDTSDGNPRSPATPPLAGGAQPTLLRDVSGTQIPLQPSHCSDRPHLLRSVGSALLSLSRSWTIHLRVTARFNVSFFLFAFAT